MANEPSPNLYAGLGQVYGALAGVLSEIFSYPRIPGDYLMGCIKHLLTSFQALPGTQYSRALFWLGMVFLSGAVAAPLGCRQPTGHEIHYDADCEELAQRRLGDYRLVRTCKFSGPKDRLDSYWVKPLLRLSTDHTFRFVNFPAAAFPMLPNFGEDWLNCEDTWRAGSDEFGLLICMTIVNLNGKGFKHSFIFRPKTDEHYIETMDCQDIASFKEVG